MDACGMVLGTGRGTPSMTRASSYMQESYRLVISSIMIGIGLTLLLLIPSKKAAKKDLVAALRAE